jgi:hypothetical protein
LFGQSSSLPRRIVALELATRASQTGGMTAASENPIAILRIELEDIEPLIWRRVAVRTSVNLKNVHSVIQAVMGWLDYHLWEFTADDRKYSLLIPNDDDWNGRISNAATTKLSALLATSVTHHRPKPHRKSVARRSIQVRQNLMAASIAAFPRARRQTLGFGNSLQSTIICLLP